MKIKELTQFIEGYNKRLKEKFGGEDDQEKIILKSTVKLTEELGELCDEVLAVSSIQREEKMKNRDEKNLSGEFADVLIAVCMLAEDMGIDLEKAVQNKIKIIKERAL